MLTDRIRNAETSYISYAVTLQKNEEFAAYQKQ